jgi:hypothetical protein
MIGAWEIIGEIWEKIIPRSPKGFKKVKMAHVRCKCGYEREYELSLLKRSRQCAQCALKEQKIRNNTRGVHL